MDNPRRSRNRGAWLFAASVVAMFVTRYIPDVGAWFALRMVVMIAGMSGAMFGGVWMVLAWIELKRYTRLKAGIGVIARWTVDPKRWEWFRYHSKEWDKRKGFEPNAANLDQDPGTSGIEIVVTGDSILIGGNFITFEPNVAIKAYADWMWFHFTIHKRHGPPMPVNVRVPLAVGGEHHATRIVEAYKKMYAPISKAAKVRLMAYMFFGIIGGMAAITGLIALVAYLLKRIP